MSYAPDYNPTTSFADDETNQASGRSTVRTVQLDVELANASASINAQNANLKAIQRDDTKLRDFSVEPYALSEQTRAMMAASGRTPRGEWAASTQYWVGDLVQRSAVAYICQTAHNSGPSFNLGFWIAISGDGQAQAYAEQAGISQTAAAASQAAAVTAAAQAVASAANGLVSAVAAANSALAAQNSANSIAGLAPVNLSAYMLSFLGQPSASSARANLGVPATTDTLLKADAASTASVGLGDALIGVKKTFTGSYPTTQHELAERGLWIFDFMSPSEMNSFYFGGAESFDASPAAARMVLAARMHRIKLMQFAGELLLLGTPGADGIRNGIAMGTAPTLNANPMDQLILQGVGGGSSLRCGNPNMMAIRASCNFFWGRDFTIKGGLLSGSWGVGAVPEDINQTSTLVNQSFFWLDNVNIIEADEGVVWRPGPRVAGADSGAFYNRINGGYSNQIKRHHWSRKGSTWAVDANRITRTQITNRVSTRGNCAYHFEVASEVMLVGCNDEQINQAGPLATATARRIEAPCSNISMFGGYSENCTESFWAADFNVYTHDYQPLSGSDLLFNRYAISHNSATNNNRAFTPNIVATVSGAAANNTSTGEDSRQGRFQVGEINAAFDKGSLNGTIVINGFPWLADMASVGDQAMSVEDWTGITFPATAVKLCAKMAGSASVVLFFATSGGGTISLQHTHLSASVTLRIKYRIKGG